MKKQPRERAKQDDDDDEENGDCKISSTSTSTVLSYPSQTAKREDDDDDYDGLGNSRTHSSSKKKCPDKDIQGYWENEFRRQSLLENSNTKQQQRQQQQQHEDTAATTTSSSRSAAAAKEENVKRMKPSNDDISGMKKVSLGEMTKRQASPIATTATNQIQSPKNQNVAQVKDNVHNHNNKTSKAKARPKQACNDEDPKQWKVSSTSSSYPSQNGKKSEPKDPNTDIQGYWENEFRRRSLLNNTNNNDNNELDRQLEGLEEGKYDSEEHPQEQVNFLGDDDGDDDDDDSKPIPPPRLSSSSSSVQSSSALSASAPTTLARTTPTSSRNPTISVPGAHSLHGPDYNGESESLFVDKMEQYDDSTSSQQQQQQQSSTTITARTSTTTDATSFPAPINEEEEQEENDGDEEGLATAMAVSDAEPVFYAKDVQHDPTRRRMFRLKCLVLVITIALVGALIFIFTRNPPPTPPFMTDDEDDEEYFADERCRNLTLVAQNPALICRCYNTTEPIVSNFTNATWDLFDLGRQVLVNASVVGPEYIWNLTDCSPQSNAVVSIMILASSVLDLDETITRQLVGALPTIFPLLVMYNTLGGLDWVNASGWDLDPTDSEGPFGVDFFSFRVVTTITLPNNNLIGTIPPDIRLLTSLRRLDLSNNPGLVGTLPPELGSNSAMKELYISDTNLEGSIPSSFGGLGRIDVMELRNNGLSGTLPPELFTPRLRVLNLSRNRFNGTIPSAIANSSRLQAVLLAANDLTGTIPGQAFGELSDLELVSFGTNNFTGSIPSEIGSLQFLEFSSYVDSGLSGNVPESFCDETNNNDNTIQRQMVGECSSDETESVTLECSCCLRSFDLNTVVGRGGVVATCVEELPEFLLDRLF